jgi:rhodanese-related sulfurtransferase
MSNNVIAVPAAPSRDALAHFEQLFRFETDCWDVHDALSSGQPGFVLLDVRGPDRFMKGHVSGALSLPHGKITATRMANWPPETLFVVYCAGPHCNGAARAAVRLSGLGRPVKIMIGGITGWLDEGFALSAGNE